MHKLHIKPMWVLRDHAAGEQLMPRLLPLLAAIHETGSLALACTKNHLSYRHGWGLVREAGIAFGAPMLDSTRGRGARLTALGEKLLWAEKRIAARLSPTLESLATELEAELERATPGSRGVLRMNASHAYALTALRDLLTRRHIPLELNYQSTTEALASFHHGGCDIGGFHVPLGALEGEVLPLYAKWLKPEAHVLVNLIERRQGIIVAASNPKNITAIADLARTDVRFVNRQPGSGTRLILERLLEREGIPHRRIRDFDRAEYTHPAVAAYIASGMADAGLGVETAARQFNLGYVPLVNERYFLVMRREALQSPAVERLLGVIRSKEYKAQIVKLQGLDGAKCGIVEEIAQAFPSFRPRTRRRAS